MNKIATLFATEFGKSAGIIITLLLWETAPRLGWVDVTYITPPTEVFQSLAALLFSGDLATHTLSSLKRVLAGLALAVVLGIGLGIFIGLFKRIEYALDYLFQTFRQMSAFALFPIFILFFGIGELSKTIIVFWASLWPVLLNTINSVKGVDQLFIDSAKSMGATKRYIFFKVILPASAPGIFTGIRLGGSYAIMALVAAEMIGAQSGLGYLVLYSQETFKIDDMYAAIIGLALLGLALNWILGFIEERMTNWKQKSSMEM